MDSTPNDSNLIGTLDEDNTSAEVVVNSAAKNTPLEKAAQSAPAASAATTSSLSSLQSSSLVRPHLDRRPSVQLREAWPQSALADGVETRSLVVCTIDVQLLTGLTGEKYGWKKR